MENKEVDYSQSELRKLLPKNKLAQEVAITRCDAFGMYVIAAFLKDLALLGRPIDEIGMGDYDEQSTFIWMDMDEYTNDTVENPFDMSAKMLVIETIHTFRIYVDQIGNARIYIKPPELLYYTEHLPDISELRGVLASVSPDISREALTTVVDGMAANLPSRKGAILPTTPKRSGWSRFFGVFKRVLKRA